MLRKIVDGVVVACEIRGGDSQGFWVEWWSVSPGQAGSARIWDDPSFAKYPSRDEAEAHARARLKEINFVEASGRPVRR